MKLNSSKPYELIYAQSPEAADLAEASGNTDLAVHLPNVRAIEAAYRESQKAGRAVMLALIQQTYRDGYESGLSDGALGLQ